MAKLKNPKSLSIVNIHLTELTLTDINLQQKKKEMIVEVPVKDSF